MAGTNTRGTAEKGITALSTDSSGLPEELGTGDFEAIEQPVLPRRWNKADEELPGGVGKLEDGSINTARFSEGPETEIEVSWWNKKMVWDVRREPTGHRVVVARTVKNIWRVHIMVAAGVIAATVFGLVAFGGLSLLYGLLMGAVLGIVCYGALAYEQRAGDEMAGVEEIYELDSVMWAGVRSRARKEYLPFTKEGQEAQYKEAIARAKQLYEQKYADPATGKVGKTYAKDGKVLPVPKFVVPQKVKDEFLNKEVRLSSDEIVEKVNDLMSPPKMAGYKTKLLRAYAGHPEKAEEMGRGVKNCGCTACEFNAKQGVIPALSGAEAALKRASKAKQAAANKPKTVEPLRAATSKLRGKTEPEVVDPKAKRKAKAEQALAKAAEEAKARDEAAAAEKEAQRQQELRAAAREELEAGSTAPKTKKKSKASGGNRVLIGVGAVICLLVIGLVTAIVISFGGKAEEPQGLDLGDMTTSQTTPSSTTSSAPPTPEEPPAKGEKPGVALEFGPKDPGSQDSGAGVIAAYDHRYYVQRSGTAVSELFAPGARPDAKTVQNSIDAQPSGTTYGLKVTPVVPGKEYDVVLTVNWPGQPKQEFRQKFFTTYSDGKFYVLRVETP